MSQSDRATPQGEGDSEGGETDLPPEHSSPSYLYFEVLHRGVGTSRLKSSVPRCA